MKKTTMLFVVALTCFLHLTARETDSIQIEFHQSRINFDPQLNNNGAKLDSIFHKLSADSASMPLRSIRSIKVIGAASPEGTVRFNNYLSKQRAKTLYNIFRNRGFITDSTVIFSYLGRDWQGLRHELMDNDSTPARAKALELLNEITNNPQSINHPLKALKAIDGGSTYAYLYKHLFPSLRSSKLILTYNNYLSPIQSTLPSFKYTQLLDAPEPQIETAATNVKKPFYMAIKTNMLYDAALLPNIGAEFYLGKNWTIFGDWMYGWWDKDASHYYWRAYGGDIGFRRWFGKEADHKPLTGHHLGAFGGIVTFDFELGGKGYMGGIPHGTLWDRCCWLAGIEYGYSLPITRRLNIDFSVALGYLHGKLLHYVPNQNFYQWQKTTNLNWVGPVKAEIALVWLIGRGNVNQNK